MDANIVNLIIALISGAVGGNVAGAAVGTDKNLGAPANSVIGLLGGGVGDFILKALGVLATTGVAGAAQSAASAATGANFDLSSILANVGVSGLSGGVLTAIISLIKSAMQK